MPLDQNENYERCLIGLLPLFLEMFDAEPQVEVKVKLLIHYLLKDDEKNSPSPLYSCAAEFWNPEQ